MSHQRPSEPARRAVQTYAAKPAYSASVVVPTYNRADRIGAVLTSILRQSHQPCEVIVVDDGSQDATEAVVRRVSREIRYIRIENAGVCTARNEGVALSSGSHIAFCDSDDHWHPAYLERQMALYAAMPDLQFSFANFNIIWKHHPSYVKFDTAPAGFWQDWQAMPGRPAGEAVLLDEPLYRRLLTFQPVFPSALVVSRDLFDRIGGFRASLGRMVGEDLEFTLRCSQYAPAAALLQPLVDIVKHEGNFSADQLAGLCGEVDILDHARTHHAASSQLAAVIDDRIAACCVDALQLAFSIQNWPVVRRLARRVPRALLTPGLRVKIALSVLPSPLATVVGRSLAILRDLRRMAGFVLGRDIAAPTLASPPPPAARRCRVLHIYAFYAPDYTGDGLFFSRLFPLMNPDALGHFVLATRTIGRDHPLVAAEPYIVHQNGIAVAYFASQGHSRHWTRVWGWLWLLRYARRFDVVHMHAHVDRFFISHIILRLLGRPIVASATLDDLPENLLSDYRPLYHPLIRRLMRLINVYVGISPATFRAAPSIRPVALPRATRRLLIPQGALCLDAGSPGLVSRAELGFTPGDVVLISIGSIIPRKDTLFLITALPALLARNPHIRLLLVGPKTNPEYYNSNVHAAMELGVMDQIVFAGFTERPEDYLRIADIYVAAARKEGFGNAHLEAMGAGLPSVARLLSGVNDFFIDSPTNGILFEKPDEYLDAVVRLAGDPMMRRTMGRLGQDTVRTRYALHSAAARYQTLYCELTGGGEPDWSACAVAVQ